MPRGGEITLRDLARMQSGLPDYVGDHIANPPGLTHTSFPTTNAFPDPHAQGYTLDADDNEVNATDWNPSWAWAAGAMISTLDDMRAWADVLATGTLLAPDTQRQRMEMVTTPDMPQDRYGLGIFDRGGWVGHNGNLPGYQTVAVRLADGPMTMVVMINTSIPVDGGGPPNAALANAITEIVSPQHVYPGPH